MDASAVAQLKKLLEQREKDVKVAQLRSQRLSEALRKSEDDRLAAEKYSKQLEIKFERSGRGVALLKAAKLQMEVDGLKEELAYKDNEISSLSGQVNQLHVALQRMTDEMGLPNKNKVLEALTDAESVVGLRKDLQQQVATVGALQDQLQEASSKLVACQEDLQRCTGEKLVAQRQLADVQERLSALDGNQNDLLDYVEELQNKLNKSEGDCNVLREQQDRSSQQLLDVCQLLVQLNCTTDELGTLPVAQDPSALSSGLSQLASQTVTHMQELRSQLKQAGQDRQRAVHLAGVLQEEKGSLECQVHELQQSLEECQQSYESQLAEKEELLVQSIEHLDHVLTEAQAQVQKMEQQQEEARTHWESLNRQMKEMEEVHRAREFSLKDQLMQAEEKYTRSQGLLEELSKVADSLQVSIRSQEERLTALQELVAERGAHHTASLQAHQDKVEVIWHDCEGQLENLKYMYRRILRDLHEDQHGPRTRAPTGGNTSTPAKAPSLTTGTAHPSTTSTAPQLLKNLLKAPAKPPPQLVTAQGSASCASGCRPVPDPPTSASAPEVLGKARPLGDRCLTDSEEGSGLHHTRQEPFRHPPPPRSHPPSPINDKTHKLLRRLKGTTTPRKLQEPGLADEAPQAKQQCVEPRSAVIHAIAHGDEGGTLLRESSSSPITKCNVKVSFVHVSYHPDSTNTDNSTCQGSSSARRQHCPPVEAAGPHGRKAPAGNILEMDSPLKSRISQPPPDENVTRRAPPSAPNRGRSSPDLLARLQQLNASYKQLKLRKKSED